jgi:hypothetical protein
MQPSLEDQRQAQLRVSDQGAYFTIPEAKGLWEVRLSPGKGRGIFSTCAIEKGTHLLTEVPLLSVSPPTFVPGKGYPESVMALETKAKFDHLTPAQQAVFLSCHEVRLPSDTDEDKVFRILRSNAYTTKDRRIALYPRVALINHACQPNVLNVDTAEGRKIIAARDIAAGEELFTTYIPLLADTAARQERLAQYGFQCDCDACVTQASDADRVRMAGLLEELESSVPVAADRRRQRQLAAMAAELATYVGKEGLSDYLVKTSRLALEFTFRAGMKSDAIRWARRHLEHHRFIDQISQDSSDAKELLEHVQGS